MMLRLKKIAQILPVFIAISVATSPISVFGQPDDQPQIAETVSGWANPTRYHSVAPYVTTRLVSDGVGLPAGQAHTVRPLRDEAGVTKIGAVSATHAIVDITASGATEPGEVWIHECGFVVDPATDIGLLADEQSPALTAATHAVVPLNNRSFCISGDVSIDLVVKVLGYVTDDAVGLGYLDLSDVVLGTEVPVPISGGVIQSTVGAVALMVEGQNASDQPSKLGVAPCSNPSAIGSEVLRVGPSAYVTTTLPMVKTGPGQCLVATEGFTGRITLLGVYQTLSVSSAAMPPNMRFSRHLPPRFSPQPPSRVLDSRQTGGPIKSQSQRELDLSAVVPFAATAVVLNVTVVNPSVDGYLTVYPCDIPRPEASSLNYVAGQTVANAVTVAVRTSRKICLYAQGTTDVIGDLSGWYAADGTGEGLVSTTPKRVLNTRTGAIPVAGSTTRLALAGIVAADATSVVMNLTAVGPTDGGYLTAYPCGQALPNTSSVNYAADQTVPNYVTAKLAADKSVCVFTSASAHLLADVQGWYSPSSPVGFVEMAPYRAFDSRKDAPGKVRPNGIMWLTFDTQPAAWLMNVTAVGPDAAGYISAYPCETSPLTSPPDASNLNYSAGQVVPNQVLVSPGSTRSVCFFSQAGSHLLADLAGSFTSTPTYMPVLVAP